MPKGPPQPSLIQWPFSVLKGAVSASSGGLPFGSSRGSVQLVLGRGSLALELDARFRLLDQFRVLAHFSSCTERVAPFRLELQGGPGKLVWLSSLLQWLRRNGWAFLLLLRASSSVLESRQRVDGLHRTQELVLLDSGYMVDNVLPQFQGENRLAFLTILAIARIVIRTTRKKRLYDGSNSSHRDLILFFTFDRRWMHTASLVVRKGAMLESSFPSLSVRGDYG